MRQTLMCTTNPCHGAGGGTVMPNIPICNECGAFLFWVGLGGDPGTTIEQAGVGAAQAGGVVQYFTWWAMSPGTGVQVAHTAVQPGDRIFALVQERGTSFTLSVTDSTHPANSFTTTQTCGSCANSSAEWVIERSGTGQVPDFGTLQITGATAKLGPVSGGIAAFPHARITLVNSSRQVLVQPGKLDSQGNGFADVWKAGS